MQADQSRSISYLTLILSSGWREAIEDDTLCSWTLTWVDWSCDGSQVGLSEQTAAESDCMFILWLEGLSARITRLHLNGCQVLCTLWYKVHLGCTALVPKHYHRDPRNVMMSVVNLRVSRLQSRTPKIGGFINYTVWSLAIILHRKPCLLSERAGSFTVIHLNSTNLKSFLTKHCIKKNNYNHFWNSN